MAQAKTDNNGVVVAMGVLNTDGVTPTQLTANPTTHVLNVSDGTTGSDFGLDLAARDQNSRTVAIAASSSDGTTPVNLYVDSSGNLLIQST